MSPPADPARKSEPQAPSLDERPLREQIEEEIASGRAAPRVMPQIAAQVREVTCREEYALRELTRVIEREPSLAARILRYANSAAYAGLREVTDLHQAVTRLGASMVESVAVAAATRELYRGQDGEERALMESLWEHAVGTGAVGRLLCRGLPSVRAEEAFLPCLLHDVGWVVILRALKHIEERRGAPVGKGLRAELLDSLHAECGARLLESWSVPSLICEAVRHHAAPESAPGDSVLPHVVHMADAICNKLGRSHEPDPELSLLALPSAAVLKLDDLSLATLLVDVEEAFREGSPAD